jgi:hypothetical protein
VNLLGNQPLIPRDAGTCEFFIEALFQQFPGQQAIFIERLPLDSRMWAELERLGRHSHRFLIHTPYGRRPWHILKLEADFPAYLASLKSKTRSTLKRKIKNYEKVVGRKPSLRRYEAPGEMDKFLRAASTVSADTWQEKIIGMKVSADGRCIDRLRQLAARGLVRCYTLDCGDETHAYLLGYQHEGTYHYAQTGFRQSIESLSPGTVLLYLAIEDLHAHNPPRELDFGMGDGVHKRRFANESREDTTVILLRPTWANWLRARAHSNFLGSLELVKRWIGRRVTK